MSYCRWSNMDFGCDLYCYESDRGYETHIASNRVLGEVPHVEYSGDIHQIVSSYNAQHAFLETAEREPITLPYAGESFTDGELETFRDRLLELRQLGYRFPDWVLDTVNAEIEEEGNGEGNEETMGSD